MTNLQKSSSHELIEIGEQMTIQEEAIQIANDQTSTPEQLRPLRGLSRQVDLLLAKHPSATVEMLNALASSADRKISEAVTAHPNIPIKMLDNLGAYYPLSMLQNPVLPKILATDTSYLEKFHGDKFETALRSKYIPEPIANWLAAHGKQEYQATFCFGANRSPVILAKFRKSKSAKIVAQLLEQDDCSYLAWATDLGFSPTPQEGAEPLDLRLKIDEWVDSLWQKNQELWDILVPRAGSAESLQGELVRAVGRIEGESFCNGMQNWGGESHLYEDLTTLIFTTLKGEESFSQLVKKVIDADIAAIKRTGEVGKAEAFDRKPRAEAFTSHFFVKTEIWKSHQRLGALITLWCQRHTDPVPYAGHLRDAR